VIETERLVLRRWTGADRAGFARMCADPEVMQWLGGVLSPVEAEARMDRVEAAWERVGHGRFAVVSRQDEGFLGWSGIMPASPAPIAGTPEIGWRLVREAWGQGYATEAARAALADGIGRAGLPEIWAYTNPGNVRSEAVMQRLGMTRRPDLDFEYPDEPQDSPSRPCIVYVARP
jgi:RimJ/RimL family protein N-acetyltransferase